MFYFVTGWWLFGYLFSGVPVGLGCLFINSVGMHVGLFLLCCWLNTWFGFCLGILVCG